MTCAVTPVFYARGGGWRCPVPRINPTETEPLEEPPTPKRTVAAREGGSCASSVTGRDSIVLTVCGWWRRRFRGCLRRRSSNTAAGCCSICSARESAGGYCARMTKKAPAKRSERGRLRSMRVSSSFREFVLDQLAAVPGVRDRSMFGGVGLYADDLFFGIVASDVLYFKVDDSSRQDYERAGSRPFKPYADRPMTMSYYSVPIAIVEDAPTLVAWAKRAVSVAAESKKPARKASKKKP
jgi:DNA transformation protein